MKIGLENRLGLWKTPSMWKRLAISGSALLLGFIYGCAGDSAGEGSKDATTDTPTGKYSHSTRRVDGKEVERVKKGEFEIMRDTNGHIVTVIRKGESDICEVGDDVSKKGGQIVRYKCTGHDDYVVVEEIDENDPLILHTGGHFGKNAKHEEIIPYKFILKDKTLIYYSSFDDFVDGVPLKGFPIKYRDGGVSLTSDLEGDIAKEAYAVFGRRGGDFKKKEDVFHKIPIDFTKTEYTVKGNVYDALDSALARYLDDNRRCEIRIEVVDEHGLSSISNEFIYFEKG